MYNAWQWLIMVIYIYILINCNDLIRTSLDQSLVKGIIPKQPYFRLVKYYNLPRYMITKRY